jgi:hypothetical protein
MRLWAIIGKWERNVALFHFLLSSTTLTTTLSLLFKQRPNAIFSNSTQRVFFFYFFSKNISCVCAWMKSRDFCLSGYYYFYCLLSKQTEMETKTSVLSVINDDDDDIYTLMLFQRKSDFLKLEIAIDNALIVHWSHISLFDTNQFFSRSVCVRA